MFVKGDLVRIKTNYVGLIRGDIYLVVNVRHSPYLNDYVVDVENTKTGQFHKGVYTWRFEKLKKSNKNAY